VSAARSPPLARVGAIARAHPRHLILGAVVAGLLAGPAPRPVAWFLAALGVLAAGALRLRPLVAGLCAVAIVGGALAAHARLAALDRTALHPLIGREVTVRATLLEAPRPTSTGGERALVRLATTRGSGETVLARVGGFARASASGWRGLEAGDEVMIGGTLERMRSWDEWARVRGAHAVLRVRFARATGRRRRGLAGLVDGIRRRAEAGLDGGLAAPEAALARGMVLGQDERLSPAARQDFQRSGLAHILAASGQNVVLLGALALPLLAWAGLGLRARLTGVLVLVALYVPLAGGGPSIQRAGVMGAAALVAGIAGRRSSRWYALLLAAAVTLLLDPRAVADPGWQLSFAAVVAIFALARPLRERLVARGLPPGLAEALALTGAATLGTAPLIAHHFDRVSLVSLPANVLAVPAIAPATWLGMLAGAAAQVAVPVARLLDALALYPLAYVEWLARTAAALPGSAVGVGLPSWWEVAAAYLVPAAVFVARRRLAAGVRIIIGRGRWTGPLVAVSAVLAAAALASGQGGASGGDPAGSLTVSFLDIGQGDATLIQDRGRTVLVDAGPPDGPILQRLTEAGVRRIDLLVVTHDQADHEGGAAAVMGAHEVGLVLDGAAGDRTAEHTALVRATLAHGVRRLAPERGQVFRLGRIRLSVLWPPWPPPDPAGDPNQRAIVALASVGRFDLLLPADAESDITAALSLPPVEALKVAHHGSADPGLPDLLGRLRPAVAVIEVGPHNTYGHPTPQALGALRAAGPEVYRTDRDGTVRLTVRGTRLLVQPHAGGT
jgi:competence protein ComEC